VGALGWEAMLLTRDALRPQAPGLDLPPAAIATIPVPDVEFVGYGEDCVIVARLPLEAERLTDLLNEQDRYLVTDVLAHGLADGTQFELPEIELQRDEVFLVHAAGPRGNADRRQRTQQHLVAIQLGPYLVQGYYHGLPGSDPVDGIRRRKAMVPLTEATIEFVAGGSVVQSRVETVIVNRELMDWVVQAEDESLEFPELAVPKAEGRLAKDFTGDILGRIQAA
jgi:hypothetical protein